jgi:hypothetical protein
LTGYNTNALLIVLFCTIILLDKHLHFDNHKDDFVLNDKNNIGGGGGK